MGKLKLQSTDWIEQALSGRIEDVCDRCDEHAQDLYIEFINRLAEIIPIGSPQFSVIENLFNAQVRRAAETAYPLGLHDGVSLAARWAR